MAKVQTIEKKTHAYIIEDGVVVRAISEATVAEYQKEGKQVYTCKATKTVDGNKVDSQNFYVRVEDFVKRTTSRSSLTSKLNAAIADRDLTAMTAAELVALLSK